jgi:hypothetical protein
MVVSFPLKTSHNASLNEMDREREKTHDMKGKIKKIVYFIALTQKRKGKRTPH